MYYQTYEDYMRSVLGYPNAQNNCTYCGNNDDYYPQNVSPVNMENTNMYPEIYKIVYPMVCKVCSENANRPVNESLVNELSDMVYTNIEVTTELEASLDIKLEKKTSISTTNNLDTNNKMQRNEKETRQGRNNYLLRDLIRILILQRLLGNRPGHGRPPMPPHPPRPPFPGGPGGFPPPRPPFPGGPGHGPGPRPPMPRDYNEMYY